MIFKFKEMNQAEAFVAAVNDRFNLDGRTFDDAEAAHAHDCFPWQQDGPIAHIDRVWDCDNADDITALQRQFDIKPDEIVGLIGLRPIRAFPEITELGATQIVAEEKVERLAKAFEGTFLGT